MDAITPMIIEMRRNMDGTKSIVLFFFFERRKMHMLKYLKRKIQIFRAERLLAKLEKEFRETEDDVKQLKLYCEIDTLHTSILAMRKSHIFHTS